MILTPLQKLLCNVCDLGKVIVTTGFEWLPKVQKNHPIWSIMSVCSQRKLLLYQRQILFTTRLSATKIFQIYSSQGTYLQLDKVD